MGRSGEPSRRSVLDAAGKIVSEQGLEGVRVRRIAAEAELSPAAVLYHFPKNSDLLFAVHQDTVDRYVEGRSSARESGGDPVDTLLAVMCAGVPPWADERVIRLLYEMHGLAQRGEEHARLLSDLWLREHALYVDIIGQGVTAGAFTLSGSAEDISTRLLALEDGLVLHLIGGNTAFSSAAVIAQFAGVAANQLNCPHLIARARAAVSAICDGGD